MFHCIIAESRTLTDYELFKVKTDEILSEICDEIEIIEGGAKGTDTLAARYAKEHGYMLKEFPAEWNRFGRAADPIRNRQMFEYLSQFSNNHCILFWDGKSPGTKNDIQIVSQYNIPYDIVLF